MSSATGETVRLMTEGELAEVLAIARENFMYVPKKKALRLYREGIVKILLALSSTGRIIGTFWITTYPASNSGLISGIAFTHPEGLFLGCNLFQSASSLLEGKTICVNLPVSARSYFSEVSYLKQGNLNLYTCHPSDILLPEYQVNNYSVLKVNGTLEEGITYAAKESKKILGMGVLTYSEGYWIIGPLSADNEIAFIGLLKHFLQEIRKSGLAGEISTYINSMHYGYGIYIIEGFGFRKHPAEWIRFRSKDPEMEQYYYNMNRLFQLDSIALGIV